jgi:hypothetical protein
MGTARSISVKGHINSEVAEMLYSWRRRLVSPFFVMMGIFFLSVTVGSGNLYAKDMEYQEVTFFVA